ncbi:glycosyltransferase [Pseudoalteromonas fuliginea]|uniref:Glycosyltransferase n=1 Tax=Pseudoalteromonas fuliginea TaxID=1872678 RepID=A0AB73BMD5_9GAMM|nr:glycosyltransferase [Pseudoalteromonas fuliginea]KAA1166153.1 glycosyltransferase [Pseudoalteromonas fuliginea]
MIINKLLPPDTESEIMACWKFTDKIYISCICVTFNHESFIKDCINAMLAQKSDYRFEIIIHDDNSSDETRAILLKYKARYPSIITLVLQSENQYSQGKKPIAITLPLCKGELVTFCDGDDYWLDEYKLSLQADYLLANPHVAISSHDAMIIDRDSYVLKLSKIPHKNKKDYCAEDVVLGRAWLLTLNWMFRRIDVSDIHELGKVKSGDTFMTSVLGQYGGSHHHENIKLSAYRQHEGGVWSMISQEQKNDSVINTFFWMYSYYKRIGKSQYARAYWNKYLRQVFLQTNLANLTKEYLIKLLFMRKIKALLARILKS